MMLWIANASKEDAEKILRTWSVLSAGEPEPVTLREEELVGIYGNYKIIRKEKQWQLS